MIISIGGRSGSGKTNIAHIIKDDISRITGKKVIYIGMDNFYNDTDGDPNYNYDHPDAFNWDHIKETINRIKNKNFIKIPIYDYKNSKQSGEYTLYESNSYDIVIFEGILALHKNIINMFDIRIYIHADSDICLWRRIERDTTERNRTIDGCGKQFFKVTKLGAEKYIKPTQKNADFIIENNYIENLSEFTSSNGYKTLIKYVNNICNVNN